MFFNIITTIRSVFSFNGYSAADRVIPDQCQIPSSCALPLEISPTASFTAAAPPAAHYEEGLEFYNDFFDASFNIWNTDQCVPQNPSVKVNHDLPLDMVAFEIHEAMSDRYWQ